MERITDEEIKPKTRGEILAEIRCKLEKFRTWDYPVFSPFQNKDLLILIPEQYYLELKTDLLDIFVKEIMYDTIFGVRMKVANVDKIYIAYDKEDET